MSSYKTNNMDKRVKRVKEQKEKKVNKKRILFKLLIQKDV